MEGYVGNRIFLVRLALGDGRRKPLAMSRLAELLNKRPERAKKYSSSKLSLLETNKQRADLDDIAVIAAVDPLQRGKAWLAGWTQADVPPVREVPLDMVEPVAPPDAPDVNVRRGALGGGSLS